MTGGEAVVAALKANGVTTLYGLPGIQLDHLFNALHAATDWLQVINARHEQGVAYMALGHAQSTGRPGVYACVPGPGFLNTAAALSTAYAVHAPVLALIGQIRSTAIGVGAGELHELPDQTAIVKGLTRWHGIARSPEDVLPLMDMAFAKLAAGIGPVAVELPADVLQESAMVAPPLAAVAPAPKEPDEAPVATAAAVLAGAKAPMIVAGAGAYGGETALTDIAERLNAPVMMHLQGRGLLPSNHRLAIGLAEGQALWAQSDVILAVGTRLHRLPAEWGLGGKSVIRIDIDPKRFGIGPSPAIAIAADAPKTLGALRGRLQGIEAGNGKSGNESWAKAIATAKAATLTRLDSELAPQMAYLREMADVLPQDVHVVADYTQIGYVCADRFPVTKTRQMLTPGYQGTLGFAYATALGAKAANPDKVVVALCGDGGFLFTANEMATAVRNGIGAIGIVFVDGAYGNVQRMQRENYGGKVIATDLANPDFAKFAESFGARARTVEGAAALAEALRWAMQERGPTLIVAKVPQFPSPWALIEP